MKFKRTEKTNLSNNELLLLDFCALLGPASLVALRKKDYSIHMNIPWTHDMSDEEVKFTLECLVEHGLLEKRKRSNMPLVQPIKYIKGPEYSYSLTKNGGEEWAHERNPIWNSYCIDTRYEDNNGLEIIEFLCLDKTIGHRFATTSLACKFYSFDIDTLSFVDIPNGSLKYWKRFKNEYAWRAVVIKRNKTIWPKDVDWELYEKNRNWWRTLKELQTLI